MDDISDNPHIYPVTDIQKKKLMKRYDLLFDMNQGVSDKKNII